MIYKNKLNILPSYLIQRKLQREQPKKKFPT